MVRDELDRDSPSDTGKGKTPSAPKLLRQRNGLMYTLPDSSRVGQRKMLRASFLRHRYEGHTDVMLSEVTEQKRGNNFPGRAGVSIHERIDHGGAADGAPFATARSSRRFK
jgi:hypothetical protein